MGNEGEPDAAVFGRRVREERQRKGWRLEDLAAAVSKQGVRRHLTAYSKLEGGEREPRLAEALAIAAALELPLGALVIDDGGTEAEAERLRAASEAASRESSEALRRSIMLGNEAQRLIASAATWPGATVEAT
jgi:transcriptional regulator with XRE-family HTH domain